MFWLAAQAIQVERVGRPLAPLRLLLVLGGQLCEESRAVEAVLRLGVMTRLNVSVIVVGAFLIGPATGAMVDGRDGSEAVLILASACDVVALVLATGLSVFKPGGLWR